MAESAVIQVTDPRSRGHTTGVIRVDWVSSAAGGVSQKIEPLISASLVMLITKPGTAGNQPTDLYDLTILDGLSHDVLEGWGANRSNVNTETVDLLKEDGLPIGSPTRYYVIHPSVCEAGLTFTIANAGNTKTGTAWIIFK